MGRLTQILIVGLASLGVAQSARAQYSITWSTLEPGGEAQGGAFNLFGVCGQPDAGSAMSGGAFTLTGGYLADGDATAGCDSIDFNADGVTPDTLDIDDFLSVFGGGPCSNDPLCHDIDFNNDGVAPDTDDIEALLRVFGGGSC